MDNTGGNDGDASESVHRAVFFPLVSWVVHVIKARQNENSTVGVEREKSNDAKAYLKSAPTKDLEGTLEVGHKLPRSPSPIYDIVNILSMKYAPLSILSSHNLYWCN